MKNLIFGAVAVAALLLLLLISASANTTSWLTRHYPLLIAANAAVTLALVTLVAVQLRRLWQEYRRGVFGSRLKSRLLWMLATMAILPGAILYAVSMQFAVSSIDSWFDVRVDGALEGGLELGRSVLQAQQSDLAEKARQMVIELEADEVVRTSAARLNRLRAQAGVQSATLLGSSGEVLASSSQDLDDLSPVVPGAAQLRRARQGQRFAWVDGDAETGLTLRALSPIATKDLLPVVLLLSQPVPPNIAKNAALVESAYGDYQELQYGRQGLKRIYTLTLTLTLLLALFAAIALAFFLAHRLAEPMLMLVEGTRAVAAGDFTPRAALETADELGLLTQSFNFMTRQLGDARTETETHRAALEAARGYLESVLANLSAGVLAFDPEFRLRSSNRGATTILEDPLLDLDGLAVGHWSRFEQLSAAIMGGFRDDGAEWQRELAMEMPGRMTKTLLIRGSTLPAAGGFVIVFDDISELISAQRTAAWGEVAQRLAHEIKNPLTPIQLSAERLQIKLADRLDPVARDILQRSTQTIVNQVESMKNMVNDFRNYARTPPPDLAPVDLNALIVDLLSLYETSRAPISADLAPALAPVLADANQMRQVLHNLVANAKDALTDVAAPKVSVATRSDGRRALLTVSDNGPGFPSHTLARAFEPYVTTKTKGTGLGLAIVKKIIDEHHGDIRLINRASGGAEVIIRLPLAQSMSAAA